MHHGWELTDDMIIIEMKKTSLIKIYEKLPMKLQISLIELKINIM